MVNYRVIQIFFGALDIFGLLPLLSKSGLYRYIYNLGLPYTPLTQCNFKIYVLQLTDA